MKLSAEETAEKLFNEKYPDAKAFFLAGSVLRGEATPYSDLDIVIVFEKIEAAYRDSFVYEDWPVEVFVHDESTLKYFFEKVDAPSGYPSLPSMVKESIVISGKDEFSDYLKKYASTIIEGGPEPWSVEAIDRARYGITDFVDDLREPRNYQESYATAGQLYDALANFYFRTKNIWSAKGKTIPRKLGQENPELAKRFNSAFDSLFKDGNVDEVISLSEEILNPFGGLLFEGYKLDAPKEWRLCSPPPK